MAAAPLPEQEPGEADEAVAGGLLAPLDLSVLGAGEVENDLATGVAAFQYPVGLGRCGEGEQVADDGP